MIYLNNAATTAIKPNTVLDAIANFYSSRGYNSVHRGSGASMEGEDILTECRLFLASLFNIKYAERIAFCQNATHAINLAMFGLLKKGDHVITTIYEHNSVLRPLNVLTTRGVEFDIVSPSEGMVIETKDIESKIKSNTKMIVVNHCSNVTGTIQPITDIGRLANEKKLLFMVDAAQSAGLIDIDVNRDNINLLAFTGHKSLFGPVGTGGLYFAPNVDPEPIMFGGTGTFSESAEQPGILPDKYEAGTPNLIGIAGLIEGVRYVLKNGRENIYSHSMMLRDLFIGGIKSIRGARLIGFNESAESTPVVSIIIDGTKCSDVAEILETSYGIIVRPGLHCAPLIHQYLGTLNTGTVRFSFGYFNTKEEVINTVEALKMINKNLGIKALA